MAMELPPRSYKVIVLGDQNVGKTLLLTSYIYGSTDNTHSTPTIGIDYFHKTHIQNGTSLMFQLWDTAGQERFRSLLRSYVRNSRVAIIVYDITSIQSFSTVDSWANEVIDERRGDALLFLVGNKLDLDSGDSRSGRQVTVEQGAEKAKKLGAIFCEVSAKKSNGIVDLFNMVAKQLLENDKSIGQPEPKAQVVDISSSSQEEPEAPSGGGCACQ